MAGLRKAELSGRGAAPHNHHRLIGGAAFGRCLSCERCPEMCISKLVKKVLSRDVSRGVSKVALAPRDDYGIVNAMTVNPLMLRGLDHS